MPPFERHVFVCTNRRDAEDPRGDCATKGGVAVQKRFKEELSRRGLKHQIRANQSGCLDTCKWGVSLVVYPEGVWYADVKVEDVPELVEEHLVHGRPVERLRMPATGKSQG